jgi:phosphatidylglycerol:prolipoprotein diacylglycerol transferase
VLEKPDLRMTILHHIDPVALPLPFWPHGIHWYGIMYVLAFATAYILGRYRLRAGYLKGVSEEAYSDLLFNAMLGVVIGGRVGYVLFYASAEFIADPMFLLRINEGGMSFHGGLLGVMAAVAIWSYQQKQHVFDILDFVAPLVPAGLMFGRIGNYIGGELWGRYTGKDWGVIFPRAESDLAGQSLAQLQVLHETGLLDRYARYPTQLLQAALEGLLLFVILYFYSRKPRPRYAVSALFAIGYGVFRFLAEFVREPDRDIGFIAGGWLTMGQLLCLPLIAVGIVLWVLSRQQRSPGK